MLGVATNLVKQLLSALGTLSYSGQDSHVRLPKLT